MQKLMPLKGSNDALKCARLQSLFVDAKQEAISR
jgi:hypothetical protein